MMMRSNFPCLNDNAKNFLAADFSFVQLTSVYASFFSNARGK